MKLKLALLFAFGLASVNAMACYTVYDRAGHIVYNAQTPPIDMSRPIHESLPAVYPGATMVFDLSNDCPREQPARMVADPPPAKPSPLLTDRKTAAQMDVPHTILPSGVALISHPPVMSAGISVIPGASSPAPMIAPAVTAHRSRRPATVITEMYNPPLTVIQQGGMVSESR